MSNKYYFISDLHLGMVNYKYAKEQEDLLLSFFNMLIENKAKELYIVGDFFDSWIEYKYVVPKGHYRVFSKLYDLKEAGIKINYIAGNHDFWFGKYFKQEFDIDIIDTKIITEIDGRKFFIHHGDGLAHNDSGYRILKKILRNRLSQFLYSLIHPDIGLWLATRTSSKSRGYTSGKDYSKRDGLVDEGFKKIEEGYDIIIMGHRHKPQVLKHNTGCYFNLGDWFINFSYGIYENGKFTLKRYYDFNKKKIVDNIIGEF